MGKPPDFFGLLPKKNLFWRQQKREVSCESPLYYMRHIHIFCMIDNNPGKKHLAHTHTHKRLITKSLHSDLEAGQ